LQQLIHARSQRLTRTCRYSPICIIEEAGKRKIEFEQDCKHESASNASPTAATFVHSLSILIDLFETIVLNQEVTQNQSFCAHSHRNSLSDA
jgi:hypothetical protein